MKCKDIYEWPESYGDPEWFIHDRFGMFIHFGLFSVAARHEWVMTLEQIGAEGYKKYFDNFNPDFFDARKWAKEAKEAGLVNLKGHRTVGGMRASIYNAMPKEGVEALVAFMKKFEEENA